MSYHFLTKRKLTLISLYPLIEAILINQLYHMEIKRGVVAGQSSRIVELVGDPMKRNLPMFCPSTDHAFDTLPLPLKYDCWRNVGFLWFKALPS